MPKTSRWTRQAARQAADRSTRPTDPQDSGPGCPRIVPGCQPSPDHGGSHPQTPGRRPSGAHWSDTAMRYQALARPALPKAWRVRWSGGKGRLSPRAKGMVTRAAPRRRWRSRWARRRPAWPGGAWGGAAPRAGRAAVAARPPLLPSRLAARGPALLGPRPAPAAPQLPPRRPGRRRPPRPAAGRRGAAAPRARTAREPWLAAARHGLGRQAWGEGLSGHAGG